MADRTADRGWWRFLLVGVVASLVLAACANGGDEPAEPDEPTDDDGQAEGDGGEDGGGDGDSDGEGDGGDGNADADDRTLVIATPDTFLSHDPPVGGNTATTAINWNIYDAPFTFTFNEEDIDGVSVLVQDGDTAGPGLAERVEVSDDDRTYTFHLRRGVQFYPSGNEMTAADWEYSFRRVLEMEVGFGRAFANIASFSSPGRVIDDYTYELTLDRDNPVADMIMATVDIVILDSQAAMEHATNEDPWSHEWVDKNSIGSGPYYLASTSEAEVVLEVNPNYWGDAPYFERVIYRRVPEASDRELLLRRGDVDVADRLLQDQLDDLQDAEGVQVVSAPSNLFSVLHLNVTVEPTNDQALREAILAALPYDQIIETAYRGRAVKADSMFPPDGLGYLPGPVPEQDLDAAREALARSGYRDGASLRLAVRNDAPEGEVEALLIRDALGEIGLDVQVEVLDVGAYFGSAAEYPLLLRTAQHWLDEGQWAVGFYMLPDSVTNWSRIQIDEIRDLQVQSITTDEDARREAYERIQELWHEQQATGYLAKVNQNWATRDDIRNFVIHQAVAPQWALVSRG